MIDVKADVKKALESIKGVTAFFYFPSSFAKLPAVSYYEANNAPRVNGDDEEYMTEIVYTVDIWGETSEAVGKIALEVDGVMKVIGFRREFSHDVAAEGKVRHKTMRYKLIK